MVAVSEPGLTPTEQAPAAAVATVDVDDGTVTDLWRALLEHEAFRDSVIRALREFADGRTVPELYDALEERDVPVWLHSRIRSVALGDRREAWHLAADVLPGLGRDVGTVADLHAVAGLVDALEETPTLAVRLGAPFRERRRDQRKDILTLLDALARGLDARLVVSGLTRRFLLDEHREDLAGVSEWRNHPRGGSPVGATVETALVDLDPDGREVRLLRVLADEPGETLAYSELYAEAPEVADSRIRQVLGRLADLGLVATFGPSTGKKAELLAAGREFVDTLDAEHGRQETLGDLTDRVRKSGQSSPQAVLPDEHGEGEGSADDATAAGSAPTEGREPYRTRFMSRPAHAAAAGAADSGAVTVVKDRLGGAPEELDHRRYVSYHEGRDEAVVAVRATTPLQYMVSTAVALASPRFLDAVLPPSRLEAVEDSTATLRDRRCIGWLSAEAAEDRAVLRDDLVKAGETLEDMTSDLQRKEIEDRSAFRGEILQLAHGLAGTVVHLLEAAGVDLVREIRLPPGNDAEHFAALARSVAHSAAIQSRYGAFAAYRQLYEDREDKRRSALSPEVDAADPVGSLVGGFVVRGPDVHRFRSHLERALGHPADLHEDAPEFGVEIPVREAGREAVEETAQRVLSRKRLHPTSSAVSVLHGLVSSPYEVAEALHQLGDARYPRDVRPDEVRYALATLDADALLPEVPPTVRAVLATLLRAEHRLSDADLAGRADVSRRSLSRHRGVLEALDVVDVTADAPEEGGGWRLTLSFRTEEEWLDGRVPRPARGDVSIGEVVSDVAAALLPPEEYADPGGDVYETLSWPPDPWALVEDARLEPWVRLAARLVGADPPTEDRTVRMGPAIEQTPLSDSTAVPAD